MKRPFSVTIVLWLVLSLTVWSGLRLVTTILWWNTLVEFASTPGPLYIALSAGAWLLVAFILYWGVWRAEVWVRSALLWCGAGYSAWYWSDRLLLQASHTNWPFATLATVLFLTILSICVSVPGTKTFLSKRETHD